jgi:hypothetical protein
MTLEHETDHYLIQRLRMHGAALPFPHTHSRGDVNVVTSLLPHAEYRVPFQLLDQQASVQPDSEFLKAILTAMRCPAPAIDY